MLKGNIQDASTELQYVNGHKRVARAGSPRYIADVAGPTAARDHNIPVRGGHRGRLLFFAVPSPTGGAAADEVSEAPSSTVAAASRQASSMAILFLFRAITQSTTDSAVISEKKRPMAINSTTLPKSLSTFGAAVVVSASVAFTTSSNNRGGRVPWTPPMRLLGTAPVAQYSPLPALVRGRARAAEAATWEERSGSRGSSLAAPRTPPTTLNTISSKKVTVPPPPPRHSEPFDAAIAGGLRLLFTMWNSLLGSLLLGIASCQYIESPNSKSVLPTNATAATVAPVAVVHSDRELSKAKAPVEVAPSNDARWLDVTWLLGHSGDSVLEWLLPHVPKHYRLSVTYAFRCAWLLVEVLVILRCEMFKDHISRECNAIVEGFVVAARFAVMHVLPIVLSLVAAIDSDGGGPWSDACRTMLFADAAVYICALMPLLCMPHARRLLLSTSHLTSLRVLKLIVTPLETLVVIYGAFGRAYHYTVADPSKLTNGNDGDGDGEEDDEEHGLSDSDEPTDNFQVNMCLLWTVWLVSVVVGATFALQWFISDEPASSVRIVATSIFGTYGVGSAITMLACWCMPDVLAARGYGFARLEDGSQVEDIQKTVGYRGPLLAGEFEDASSPLPVQLGPTYLMTGPIPVVDIIPDDAAALLWGSGIATPIMGLSAPVIGHSASDIGCISTYVAAAVMVAQAIFYSDW
eukprot:CAMPEP_0203882178 /NCGR_PEP_ID=MMETSP0359-20131031/26410_1 /ASSEMBLY_ACC=CAM_ASM_000338 /TAXON_ID=268821 /ORGANISM="Scrippsiella Hangoei, Strain SHTV-5" /LENGTH=690 /DNA_ID=CAMNT_0050802187 /DNA_START=211 /DNA_END=2280 /DNA_ORIENTATION=+